jgi:hypothetical protein
MSDENKLLLQSNNEIKNPEIAKVNLMTITINSDTVNKFQTK